MAWYMWICLARVLIAPEETRSIHIPTARMVKNAASCKKTKNARAIYRHRDPLRPGFSVLRYNTRTLYILEISGEAPTRLKLILANRYNGSR